MRRLILSIFIFSILLSGCGAASETIITSTPTKEVLPTNTNNETLLEQESENPAIGEESRQVDSTDNLFSYENLLKMNSQNREKIQGYNMEQCCFRLTKEPENMHITYLAFWEIGFFVDYINPDTNESLEFKWWSYISTNDYLNGIKDAVKNSVYDAKVINKNSIDYYCIFATLEKEPGDETPNELKYHYEISWIEDGKCFCVRGKSKTPIDESILDYCQIEKISLD